MYNKWLQSEKYLQLRKALQMKKRNILQLKLNYKNWVDNKMSNHLNDRELMIYLNNLQEYHELTNEDKEAYEWIEYEQRNLTNKDEFLVEYIRSILNLSFYLKKYALTEDFETCIIIRDTIRGEVIDTLRILRYYFIPTNEDIRTIEGYPVFALEVMAKNYTDEPNSK